MRIQEPVTRLEEHPAYKTRMCPQLKAGHCILGSACAFAHSRGEQRPRAGLGQQRPVNADVRPVLCCLPVPDLSQRLSGCTRAG